MQLSEFIQLICSTLNRRQTDFDRGGTVSVIAAAMNRARRKAQRLLDFELLRTTADFTLTPGQPQNLALATHTPFGSLAEEVVINRIEKASIVLEAQTSTTLARVRPIDFVTRMQLRERLQRHYDNRAGLALSSNNYPDNSTDFPVLVRDADSIYLWPTTSPVYPAGGVSVQLDVVKWAADVPVQAGAHFNVVCSATTLFPADATFILYNRGVWDGHGLFYGDASGFVGSTMYVWFDLTSNRWRMGTSLLAENYWQATTTGPTRIEGLTWESSFEDMSTASVSLSNFSEPNIGDPYDFFLTEIHDWLFWATIGELLPFLKQDERELFSQRRLEELWRSVISWNESLAENRAGHNQD